MTYQPPQPPPGQYWQPGWGQVPSPRPPRPRRRTALIIIVVVVAVLILGGGSTGVALLASSGGHNGAAGPKKTTTPTAPPSAGSTTGPCQYMATTGNPAPAGRNVGLPADPNPTPKTGTVTVTLRTSFGDIPMALNRAEAPCTVQSFLHLTSGKFFDNTYCHRETAYDTLKVLQCGDPTGSGTGGPGYNIPDEKPTNLKSAPSGDGQPAESIYPRGVVAMANSGQPNSGGSQFFIVYGDSELPPDYTIFGTVNASGLATLDKIVANGITPGTDPSTGQTSNQDGVPRLKVTIQTARAE